MKSRAAVAFLYALVCLIWGSTWFVIKIGLEGVPPFLAAGLRFALASGVLFALVAWRRRPLSLGRDGRIAVLSCGLLSFTFCYAAVYWAEQYVSSGLSAVLYSVMPLATALLSRFWTRAETLPPRRIAGIAIGMAGTLGLFWTGAALAPRQMWGMIAILFSVVGAAVNVVTVKKRGRGVDLFAMNAYAMAIGAVCLLALSLVIETRGAPAWSPANVLAIVYLALVGSVVAFLSYYHLLTIMDATRLSLITLIFPVIALLFGRFFLGETLTLRSFGAIAVILAGVAVALAPRRQDCIGEGA